MTQPSQLARNAASDAIRAAIALEGKLTYAGLDDADTRIVRAIEALRSARKGLKEAAKPIRAQEVINRREARKSRPKADPLHVPEFGEVGVMV